MNDGLKKLIPGLIPLLVFIIADAIWGPQIGVIVALVIGVLELLIVYIRDRIIDRFILLDTAILVLFSSLSLITHDEIFFKLKPAFMESFLVVVIGISVFTSKNLILMMSRRFMPTEIGGDQEAMMKKMMIPLFWMMLVHVFMIVYAAYFMSNEWWGFISGVLFYVIVLSYMAFFMLRNRWRVKKMQRTVPFFDANNGMKSSSGKFTPSYIQIRLFLTNQSKESVYLKNEGDIASFTGNVSSKEGIEAQIGHWIGGELGLSSMQVQLANEYNLRAKQDKIILVVWAICEDDFSLGSEWKAYAVQELSSNMMFDLKSFT
ncbi:septation protein IspZ [Halosquirtibacter laminarini]|uniref:Septation protein IspZ n=1 Tax=Halosquirtibacter laminarini TaxID=3374600 RepID=A0AC61NL16_9BACT|nr:septation protein IspZ [Prolixibacteraceae bacterium]